jgi:hypothetical protein
LPFSEPAAIFNQVKLISHAVSPEPEASRAGPMSLPLISSKAE